MNTLQINNLTKFIDNQLVIDNFSFDFGPGIYAIFGQNHSGKSTLLNTIVDSIKMVVGSKIGSVGASKAGKLKTIFMMCGVTLMLFYNLPFEIWGIRVADTLIMIATVLSIISGIEYYTKNRKYLLED